VVCEFQVDYGEEELACRVSEAGCPRCECCDFSEERSDFSIIRNNETKVEHRIKGNLQSWMEKMP
jgi:hypothetical protein